MTDTRDQVQELIREAEDDVQQVVSEVLRLERDKLHMKIPREIVKDITDVVKKLVK